MERVQGDAIRRLQDALTIGLLIQRDQKAGAGALKPNCEWLSKLSFTPEQDAAIKSLETVTLPIFITRKVVTSLRTEFAFFDPRLSELVGAPVQCPPLMEWFSHWVAFNTFQLDEKGEDAALINEYLVRAVVTAKEQFGAQEALAFLDRLWEHRWILGARTCAAIRMNVLKEMRTGEELDLGQFAFRELEQSLVRARNEVQTLDEWIERLYGTWPQIWCCKWANEEPGDESESRQRFASEAFADTGALFSLIATNGLSGTKPWSDAFLPKRDGAFDFRATRRKMSYECNGRIMYPKFWLDEAIATLNGPEGGPSPQLDTFDYQHLRACLFRAEPMTGDTTSWYEGNA
jgi:hypothetical protein